MHTRDSPHLLNHRLGGFQPSVLPLKVSFPHVEGASTRASRQHATVSPSLDPSVPPPAVPGGCPWGGQSTGCHSQHAGYEIVLNTEIGRGDFRG